MRRLPVQDRRTQSLRPVATPGQGQPGVSGASLAGQALTEAAKLLDQGQKIYNAFQAARIQDLLNQLEHAAGERWNQLQQMRGFSAMHDEEGGYTSQIGALEELRNSQMQQLPSHLQSKYRIVSDKLLNRERNRFQGYALAQARAARRAVNQTAEKNAKDKAAMAASFEEVQEIVDDLFWLTDDDGNRTMGSTLMELVLEGAPQELIDRHEKELRADAHLASISNQITAAREQRDVGLIVSAQEHLEKAREFLPVDVYKQAKERIEKERVIVAAESTYENLLTIAVRESPDEDARWVDEGKLADSINSIEDPNVRSAVRKIANEYKPLREAARKSVVDRYAASALKTFWDTRSITTAVNSAAMLWLERNDTEEWNRVRKEMETWASRWRREARANESLALRRQRQAAQDPENIRNFWYLQEDMLMNPHKYAAEDYTIDTLMSEWGGRIPVGFHDRMFSSLDKHKKRMQTEGYRLAQEHFRRAVNARRDRFEDAQKRREFVGVMYELYDQEIAPDQRPTIEDINRIIALADTRVLRRRWVLPDKEMTYAEALADGYEVHQHQDPETGEWVDGPPPPGMSVDTNVRAGGVAATGATQAAPGATQPPPTTTVAPPPGVDPDLWRRAREAVDPADRNNPAVIREAMEILAGG